MTSLLLCLAFFLHFLPAAALYGDALTEPTRESDRHPLTALLYGHAVRDQDRRPAFAVLYALAAALLAVVTDLSYADHDAHWKTVGYALLAAATALGALAWNTPPREPATISDDTTSTDTGNSDDTTTPRTP